MKATSPGHSALTILSELVDLVNDRMTFRAFMLGHPQLAKLYERAQEVTMRATRGVKPYDLKPKGEATSLVGFCELCGSYHSQLVEVHP